MMKHLQFNRPSRRCLWMPKFENHSIGFFSSLPICSHGLFQHFADDFYLDFLDFTMQTCILWHYTVALLNMYFKFLLIYSSLSITFFFFRKLGHVSCSFPVLNFAYFILTVQFDMFFCSL